MCLSSCEQQAARTIVDVEGVITQKSDSLHIISSENGRRQYVFTAPLMEEYGMSKEPYMEFRKGIRIETYNDSTGLRESSLVADYAIFLENQKLWQAKGNVVAVNNEGQKLETQQLFWNQNTKRIYSNVDTRVSRPNGERITGMGFESDEAMKDWVFRRPTGTILINTDPTDGDATSARPAAAPGAPAVPVAPPPVSAAPGAAPTPVAAPPTSAPPHPAPAASGASGVSGVSGVSGAATPHPNGNAAAPSPAAAAPAAGAPGGHPAAAAPAAVAGSHSMLPGVFGHHPPQQGQTPTPTPAK